MIKMAMVGVVGACFAAAALFFAYYTVRLIYVNVTVAGMHRQSGMFIGAVAFPIATLLFGAIAWYCLKSAAKLSRMRHH
jgi:hypothetical protein